MAIPLLKTCIEVEINQGQTKHLERGILPTKRHKSGAKNEEMTASSHATFFEVKEKGRANAQIFRGYTQTLSFSQGCRNV